MEFTNPIIPGFAPDPSVVYVDGVFYLANSSFHLFPGIPIYASQNLQEWILIGHAINRLDQLNLHNASTTAVPLQTGNEMIASGGLFAPTIRHHRGTFYIVCTNASLVPSLKVDNFLISTTDIWGSNWSNPISIPYPGIDPSLFFDDDDRVYLQGSFSLGLTAHPSCTIKQFQVDVQTGKALSDAREIWPGHCRIDTEGPHIYKVGKWYYLLVAEGGTFEHHMLSIARSDNVWGPYKTFEGNPILTADGKPDEYVQHSGHGELFQDEAGQWWAVVLAVRNEATCQPLGRETFLTRVEWPMEGWPKMQHPTTRFTSASPVVASIPSARDAYLKGKILSLDPRLENLFIRDPDPSCYRLPSSGLSGPLSLYPSLADLAQPVGTSTFIGRRQRSLNAIATAEIELSTLREDKVCRIAAGLSIYKDHLRHILLRFDNATNTVTFRGVNGNTKLDQSTTGALIVDDTARVLHLKIVSSAEEYCGFAAATAEGSPEKWVNLGSWKTREFAAREMTGPVFGIFAHAVDDCNQCVGVVFPNFTIEN